MIIGITGTPPSKSGKDTVADHLVKEYGFVKVSFADPMKRICAEVFRWDEDTLWGSSDKRNEPDGNYLRGKRVYLTGSHKDYLTPRYALQRLGDWGRDCYQDIWVDHCIQICQELLYADGCMYDKTEGIISQWENTCQGEWKRDDAPRGPYRGAVIPDVRFDNEAEAVKKAGGRIWCIERPGAGLEGEAGKHVSEAGITTHLIDECVRNDRAVSDLLEKVDHLMKLRF